MSRLCFVALGLMFALACRGEKNQGLADGGKFMLPDAGPIDTGPPPDTGRPDSGPFQCEAACGTNEFCGCLGTNCGCLPQAAIGNACDLQVAESCAAGACVPARSLGADVAICSDGREGIACSKTADVCQTALGCVCLTSATGGTDCACTETHTSQLCDIMVPETCVDGRCIRVPASTGGVYFLCSDGSEGQPCEVANDNCQTSLGCTCPIVLGRRACRCLEPGASNEPCDPDVGGSCVAGLMCISIGNRIDGISSVCGDGNPLPDAGTSIPCDPNNPGTCPPGFVCVGEQGSATCEPV